MWLPYLLNRLPPADFSSWSALLVDEWRYSHLMELNISMRQSPYRTLIVLDLITNLPLNSLVIHARCRSCASCRVIGALGSGEGADCTLKSWHFRPPVTCAKVASSPTLSPYYTIDDHARPVPLTIPSSLSQPTQPGIKLSVCSSNRHLHRSAALITASTITTTTTTLSTFKPLTHLCL
jgi:hypothetical protein